MVYRCVRAAQESGVRSDFALCPRVWPRRLVAACEDRVDTVALGIVRAGNARAGSNDRADTFNIASQSISDDARLKDFLTKPSFAETSSVELGLSKDRAYIRITSGEGSSVELSKSRPSLFGRNTAELSDLRDIALESFRAKELRQLVHCVRWRRKDPVIQLPPDASHELAHTVTTGLSLEQSQTLTESLGLDLGGKAVGLQAKLSYKLQEQFGLQLSITATEETSTKLTLSNQSKDRYRIFALWQVDHRLSVYSLKVPVKINISQDPQPEWKLCDQAEFTIANQPFITYTEVSHQ